LPFISALCAAIDRLPQGAETDKARARIKSIDGLAFDLLSEGKLRAMLGAARAIDETSMQYSLTESFKPDPDVNLTDTLGLIRGTRAQIASRSSILNDPTHLVGQSQAWDEWVNITEETVRDLNTRLALLNEVRARVFPSEKSPE
jgi:hypothetical protein